MRFVTSLSVLAVAASLAASRAEAQTAINLIALQGLAPFSTLDNSDAGKAALAANFTITRAIQTGTANQPGLQPLSAQQEQALRDAFSTTENATELADGLGTKLGGIYQAAASYASSDDGKTVKVTNVAPAVGNLLKYSFKLISADASAAKFFFANGTVKTGSNPAAPASPAALAILTANGGTTDLYGKAYGKPAGSPGADKLGDSRPFQTEPTLVKYDGTDYFGAATNNSAYLYGPPKGAPYYGENETSSPTFPSGHSTYAYTEATLLAILVPQRYQQMITRGAEFGNSRIILGAHYTMDVIAGRTLAYYDLSQLLAENPAYLNLKEGKAVPVANYAAAVKAAHVALVKALKAGAGETIAAAAADDSSRFANKAADEAFYELTQTYGLPVVYPAEAGKVEDVGKIAPDAGYLLTAAFPYLSLAQADHILTVTEGPGGGFLDDGSAFGLYSRLDLYKAAADAQELRAKS